MRQRAPHGSSTADADRGIRQGDTPDWAPLLKLVGEIFTADFMWMFEVKLSNGTKLQAYKHYDTRRYLHLDPTGTAFTYEEPDRYRRVPDEDLPRLVYLVLPTMCTHCRDNVSTWQTLEFES